MIEKGLVTEVSDGEAVVSFVPSENCLSCRGCACGKDGKTMLMRVKAVKEVEPGDIVTVEVNSRALLSSGFMVFILPLIIFIIGALAAAPLFRKMNLSMDSNAVGILVGFVLMIVTFFIVFVFEQRRSHVSALSPRIIGIEKETPSVLHAENKTKANHDS